MNFKIIPAIFCLIIFPVIILHAQLSNLVVFTTDGEPFTVLISGVQQNPDPGTYVRIERLYAHQYKVKTIFQNKKLVPAEKIVELRPGSEIFCEVLRNKKGVTFMKIHKNPPPDLAREAETGQQVYVFSTTPRVTTTTVNQTTTTSTGTLSITGTTTIMIKAENPPQPAESLEGHDHPQERENPDYPAYTGPRGCEKPMSSHSFDQALESIAAKSFESSKLTIAKQVAGSNCMLCRQVKEIMKLFTFESSRLDFAKFAYKYTWDVNNYFLLNDAFEFETSVDDLNKYINQRK